MSCEKFERKIVSIMRIKRVIVSLVEFERKIVSLAEYERKIILLSELGKLLTNLILIFIFISETKKKKIYF